MLYSVKLVDEIRLWWDTRNEVKSGFKYKVTVNDKTVIYTERLFFNFKNLSAGKEYKFKLAVVDQNKNEIGKVEEYVASTLPAKAELNVTLPPYNAVGDGVTDNTLAFKKAFADCGNDKYIRVPVGVYVCDKLDFNGSVRITFDSGATMATKAEVIKL